MFDAAVILLISGIFLRHLEVSEDFFGIGIMGMIWVCFSWVLQSGWVPDKLWVHITSAVLLMILLFVVASIVS